MRDIAPIFYNEDQKLKSISFEFNGYGKYPDYFNDNKISKFISNYLNIPTKTSDLLLREEQSPMMIKKIYLAPKV